MLKKSLVNAFYRRPIKGTEENGAMTKMNSFKSAEGPMTTGWKWVQGCSAGSFLKKWIFKIPVL